MSGITKMKQSKSQPRPKSEGPPAEAASTPPKLSLFTLPPKPPPDPQGFPTPPLQTPATVPFQWEEAPGRPRSLVICPDDHHKPKSMRSLDLPPRMLNTSCTPSPTLTTVLDGQCDRTLSSTWSFRKLSTGRSAAGIKKLVTESCKIMTSSPAGEYGARSSWRWGGGSAKVNKEEEDIVDSFNIFDDHYNEVDDGINVDEVVQVKKVKRKGSFFSARSHFWARVQESVHESLKQMVVPWRRSGRAGHPSKREVRISKLATD